MTNIKSILLFFVYVSFFIILSCTPKVEKFVEDSIQLKNTNCNNGAINHPLCNSCEYNYFFDTLSNKCIKYICTNSAINYPDCDECSPSDYFNTYFKKCIFNQTINGVLKINSLNKRYFTNSSGKAIYLTGSHTWDVLIDEAGGLDYNEFLDYMALNNQNFIRLWANMDIVWNRAGSYTSKVKYRVPTIHPRTGPGTATDGNPKFDLTKYNSAYSNKLKSLIQAASKRGIFVGIMLFEGWWNADQNFRNDAWYGHPYNPLNNINLPSSVTTSNVHSLDISQVVSIHEAYVKHIINTVNEFDNIIYEVSNEDAISTNEWQIHIMNLIRTFELTKPKQHSVWLTTRTWNTTDEWLWASSANALSPRWLTYFNNPNEPYIVNPPVTDGSKVVILDTDHFCGGLDFDWREMTWKSFLRGYNPILMDPYLYHDSWSLEPIVAATLGYTRIYADKIDLVNLTPTNNSSHCSTTYCLRNAGKEYLIYQPNHSSFNVNLSAGNYNYEWFDPQDGTVKESGTLDATGGNYNFLIPTSISSDALLYLKII